MTKFHLAKRAWNCKRSNKGIISSTPPRAAINETSLESMEEIKEQIGSFPTHESHY